MKESIIILGKINKKFLLPFILAVVQIIYNIFNEYYPEKANCGICAIYADALSKIFIRIFPFIFKISDDDQINAEKKITKKKWLPYFLLCLFDVVAKNLQMLGELLVDNYIDNTKSFNVIIYPTNDFITLSFETIFLVCISILLLKYKYYKHHIISIIIFMIFRIISDIFFNNYETIDRKFFLIHFIKMIEVAIDSFVYCYEKYMMEKLYCPYWNVAFFPGVSLFFMQCIILIPILTDLTKKNLLSLLQLNFIYILMERILD